MVSWWSLLVNPYMYVIIREKNLACAKCRKMTVQPDGIEQVDVTMR